MHIDGPCDAEIYKSSGARGGLLVDISPPVSGRVGSMRTICQQLIIMNGFWIPVPSIDTLCGWRCLLSPRQQRIREVGFNGTNLASRVDPGKLYRVRICGLAFINNIKGPTDPRPT